MASFVKVFLGNFAWVSAGSMASMIISFFSSLLIIIHLSVYEYGLLVLALSIVAVFEFFLDFGLSPVISTEIAQELGKERLDYAKTLIISFSKFTLFMGIVVSLLIFIFSNTLADFVSKPAVASLIRIASLMIFLTSLKYIFELSFESSLRFKYRGAMDTLESLSKVGWVVSFIYLGVFNLETAFLCYSLAMAVSLSVSWVFLIRSVEQYRGIRPVKKPLFKNIIKRHGKYRIIMQSFQKVQGNLPLWILEFLLGVEAVGIYALARRVYDFISLFLKSIEKVLIPTISYEIVRNKERVKRIIARGMKYGLFISLLTVISSWILINPILSLLGLERYYPSIPIFNVIVLNLVIIGGLYLARPLLFALKAQKELTLIHIATTIEMIVLTYYLTVLLHSPLSLPLTLIISNITVLVLRYRIIFKIAPSMRPSWREVLFLDQYDKNLLRRILHGISRSIKGS